MSKYYSIEDERGGLLGYVKGKDNVDAYNKVLSYYAGCCPDSRLINEVNKREIRLNSGRDILNKLKTKDLVEV